jgi:hypothetical protein
MTPGWVCQEPGWWVHETMGGVCREEDRKWYAYPKNRPESERLGPFDTANKAAAAMEGSGE